MINPENPLVLCKPHRPENKQEKSELDRGTAVNKATCFLQKLFHGTQKNNQKTADVETRDKAKFSLSTLWMGLNFREFYDQ